MKKIIIFGATGNVGSYLVDYAKKFFNNQYEIIAVGHRKTDFFKKLNIEYYSVDISKFDDFKKLPTDEVYAVINLAGILPAYYEGTDYSKYFEINTIGGYNILEYCRINKVKKIIYSQTFSDLAGYWEKEIVLKPYMERKLNYNNDHTIYAISKCAVFDLVNHYNQCYNIDSYIFRLPNIYMYTKEDVYRVDGKLKKVGYRLIIDNAIAGNDIEVWGDPTRVKDIVYVADLCQMICKSINSDIHYGVYNVGTGVGTSMEQQIDDIIEVFCPKNHKSRKIYCPEKPSTPQYIMDISNAEKDFGYIPEFNHKRYLEELKKEMELDRFADLRRKD